MLFICQFKTEFMLQRHRLYFVYFFSYIEEANIDSFIYEFCVIKVKRYFVYDDRFCLYWGNFIEALKRLVLHSEHCFLEYDFVSFLQNELACSS